MKIKIIDAKKEHVGLLAELESNCFASPRSFQSFSEEIEYSSYFYLLAMTEEDEAVGYIGVQIICGEANIQNLAVLEKFRRQGVADALLSKAIDKAKEEKSSFITLEVRQSNSAAIGLYKKHGFAPVGLRKDFYSKPDEDAILMTKFFETEEEK